MLNNFRKRRQEAGAGGESGSRAAKPQSAAAQREVKRTPPKLGFFRSAAACRCHSGCCWRTTSEHAHSEPTRRGKNAVERRKLQCALPHNKDSPEPKLRTSNCRGIWNRESAMTSSDDDEYNVIDERNHGGVKELSTRCRSATIAGSATTATSSPPPPRGECRRLSLPPRRHAICTELERFIVMENGENLRTCHKKLIIKDYLESLRFIR